jgi:hypothetical protein
MRSTVFIAGRTAPGKPMALAEDLFRVDDADFLDSFGGKGRFSFEWL